MRIRICLTVVMCLCIFPKVVSAEPSDYVLSQFVAALQLEETVQRIHEDAIRDQTRGRPERKEVEVEIRTYLQNNLNYEKLEPVFKKVVAEKFSENEMWEIIRFLNSASGRKFVGVIPTLSSDLYLAGFEHYRALQPKLEQVVVRAALERPDPYRFQLRMTGKAQSPEAKYLMQIQKNRQRLLANEASFKD